MRVIRGVVGLALLALGTLAVIVFLFMTLIVARLPGADKGQLIRNDAIYVGVAIGSFVVARLAWPVRTPRN